MPAVQNRKRRRSPKGPGFTIPKFAQEVDESDQVDPRGRKKRPHRRGPLQRHPTHPAARTRQMAQHLGRTQQQPQSRRRMRAERRLKKNRPVSKTVLSQHNRALPRNQSPRRR